MVAEQTTGLACLLAPDGKCIAAMLQPVFSEWHVQLFILLPAFLILLRVVLHGFVSMGLPIPFVHERIKDFTKDKAAVSRLDADVIEHLAQAGQQTRAIMDKADAGLQWLYGSPIFSLASFQRTLFIALVYPSLVLLLVWLVSGLGTLGGFKVLPDMAFWSRLGLVLSVLGEALFVWLTGKYAFVWAAWLIGKFGWNRQRQGLLGIVIFMGAFVIAISGAVAFVFAFAGAGALAFTFAFVGAFGFAFPRVGAVAGAGAAGAVTFPGAIAVVLVGTGAVGAVVAIAGATALYKSVRYLSEREQKQPGVPWLLLALLLYAALLLIVVYGPPQDTFFNHLLPEERTLSFVFLLFLTCLPIINAFSDWLSVSVTRWLFGKYRQSDAPTLPWWWIVLDLLFTLLLCLGLYHSVILLLSLMQASGWPVDVQQTVRAFNEQPLGGQSSWLTWLAITNFIPLGLHYLMIVWGISQRRWGVPTHVAAYMTDLQAGKALSTTDARTLAMFLTWDRWMKVSTMLLLIPSAYMLLQWLLHASLRVWL